MLKMDAMQRLFGYALLFSVLSGICDADDVCVKKTPCSCMFPNGTGIDLTPTAQATFYTADKYDIKKNGMEYELHTYYFHPCTDKLAKVNSTGPNDTCGNPLSICRHLKTMVQVASTDTYKFDSDTYNFMGTVNYTEFSTDGRSIVYANGPSATVVMLVCAETDNQLQAYSLAEPNRIVLSFYSKDACLKQIEEVGRSFGSTLLIIFFSLVIFYLVLGVLTRKFLMGATGIEVVPNLNFWMDLPNLVKDGWAFAIAGFKLPTRSGPVASPDPNSYDSI